MRAIRHYLFMLAGLAVLSLFIRIAQAAGVGVFLMVAIISNKLPGIIAKVDEYGQNVWTPRLVYLFTFLSLAVALVGAIFIFIWYGWIPTSGYVILYLGYFAVREDPYTKSERAVTKVRESLREIVTAHAAGKLTREQMEYRFFNTLEQDLIDNAYNLSSLAKILLAEEGMSGDQYQTYLRLLEQYLSGKEQRHFYSRLHQNVRVRLGLSAL